MHTYYHLDTKLKQTKLLNYLLGGTAAALVFWLLQLLLENLGNVLWVLSTPIVRLLK